MAEYNKVYASLKPELPKVIQQEQIYVYAPKSSRSGMKSISSFNITAPVASVQYDTTDGITVTGNSSLASEEVSGETVTQNFQSEFRIPIRPGKYISIDATADNKAIKVKVDDTQLALDYYKINKTSTSSVPAYSPTAGRTDVQYAFPETGSSLVQRGINGEARFNWILTNEWKKLNSSSTIDFDDVALQLLKGCLVVAKTTSDTGTLTITQLVQLQRLPQLQLQYNGQTYYRMDPLSASNGTLNYIHIDSVQKGTGGYTATGKCFSITVRTREWKVFDLEFGGSGSGSGNGIEQIIREASNTAQSVSYDSTSGATIEYTYKTLIYKDSTTGEIKSKAYPAQLSLPILPGKYISMDANSENDALEVKVDDTALSQDYIKLDKTKNSVIPEFYNGKIQWDTLTTGLGPNSVVQRAADSSTYLSKLYVNRFATTANEYEVPTQAITYGGYSNGFTVEKTPTDTGTLTANVLDAIKSYPNAGLKYDNQSYVRMDPTNAPNGTINFIHVDSIEDGNGSYKATGKYFSITVSTREWKVVDLDFGGSTRTTHNLTITDSTTTTKIYFSLTNNRPETYEGAPAGLWSALENSPIACTVDNGGYCMAGMITIDGDDFKVFYGNSEELIMIQPQVDITDSLV